MSQIFISYARKDHFFVDRLRDDLNAAGIEYWIDTQNLSVGTNSWEKAIRAALKSDEVEKVVWIVSPASFDSSYVRDEISIARLYKKKIYPVWIEGDDWLECVPIGTGEIQNIDARKDYKSAFNDLLLALGGEKPDLAVPEEPTPTVAPEKSRNPYKGLAAFTEADTGDFFGRDALVTTLLDAVKTRLDTTTNRFLAVLGPSGAGKSSVVMAGLLPALKTGRLPGSDVWTYLPRMVPGSHPVEKLADALYSAMPEKSLSSIETDLNTPGGRYLHRLARQLSGDRVVLYIDQFEELFTLTNSPDERQQFIDLITHAATEPESKLMVLLSMRADFYGHPMHYPELGKLVTTNTQAVLPMSISELRDAIEKPARLADVGLHFDPGLVADIIFALRERDKALAGALPLLQFTLERLFVERDGTQLTRSAYEAIGGVQGAIGTHCEAVFAALPEAAQEKLGAVFLPLVNVDETTGEATRRRASLDAVTADPDAKLLVDELVDNRLLQSGLEDDTPYVEIAHEALLTSWERLADWIEATRDDLRVWGQVQRAVNVWLDADKDEGFLWKGERLNQVLPVIKRLNLSFTPNQSEFLRSEVDRIIEIMRTTEMAEHTYRAYRDRVQELGGDLVEFELAALQNPSPVSKTLKGIRKFAEDALSNSANQYAADLLLELVANENANVELRQTAARILGRIGDERSVDLLIEVLTNDVSNVELRRTIIEVLGRLGDLRLVVPLIKIMTEDEDEIVRVRAIRVLGRLGDKRAVIPIINSLSSDNDFVADAAFVLGQLQDPRAIDILAKILLDDSDPQHRVTAARALGDVGDEQAINPLISALSEDASSDVRREAARLLGIIGNEGAFSPLVRALKEDSHFQVRIAAVSALGDLGDSRAISSLSEALLEDRDIDIRRISAAILGKFKDIQITAPLARSLYYYDDLDVRFNSIISLARLGTEDAWTSIRTVSDEELLDQLIYFLVKGHQEDDHPLIARILKEIGTPEALAAVKRWEAQQRGEDTSDDG